MKILQISNVHNNPENRKTHKPIEKTNNNINIITLPKVYYGKDLISFGQTPFYKTLQDNYFQLPKNCFPDEFQLEAGKAINNNQSVLVEAPTGIGKTAIANYAITKNLKEGKKTFYTTPLKALSNQKYKELKEIFSNENVGIITGDRKENPNAPVVVMTTEVYRNMAVANTYNKNSDLMKNLKTVIFDEFHYLGDTSRGNVWEEALMHTPINVHTVSLSATSGNSSELTDWLNSISNNDVKLISTTERKVPLIFDTLETKAYKKSEDKIQKQIKKTGTYNYDDKEEYRAKPDLSDYKAALNKLIQNEQLPAIFFIFSKKFSKELLNYFSKEGKTLTSEDEKAEIKSILEKYKNKKYIGNDLNEDALLKGYAIHNASIIPSQKELIEELFQKKLIKVVIATETLAAGINMPAKTTVISSAYKPCEENNSDLKERMLTSNEFKQMAGRAGRRGIDTQGFVYVMPVDRNSEMDFLELETSVCNPLESKYNPDYSFLCGFFEHNDEPRDLKNLFEKSFYAYSKDEIQSQKLVQTLIQDSLIKTNILKGHEFVEEDDGAYFLTNKGLMASSIKGFDPIVLIDTIYNQNFKDITPETLALILGAMADSDNFEESQISFQTDFKPLTSNTQKHIENIKAELITSVEQKFNVLSKSFNSFKDYNEMLNFVINLKTENTTDEISRDNLQNLKEINSKLQIIQQKNCTEPDINNIITSLNKGEILPSEILYDCLEKLENYKKHIKNGNIELYIQELQKEINDNRLIKGKKSQKKSEQRKKELQQELSQAQTMQNLEKNIYNAINSNEKFIKKNPPQRIRKDLKEAQINYIKTVSKQELENEIKSLIQIENYMQSNNLREREKENRLQAEQCIKSMLRESEQLLHEENIQGLLNCKRQKYGKTGAQAAYNWILMNNINPYSTVTNWKELTRIMPDTDEGTIYRNILQTADLLGQISQAAQMGMKYAENQNEYEYYKHLKNTAIQSKELMIKPPIEI